MSTASRFITNNNISLCFLLAALTSPQPVLAYSSDGSVLNNSYFLYLSLLILVGVISIVALYRHRAHRQSEEKLQQSEEQLHWALWGSGDGLWDWDISSGLVNRKGIPEMLGYQPEDFDNTTVQLLKLMHPDDTAKVSAEVKKHLKGDSSHFEAEYRALSKDGGWRWILDKGKVVSRDSLGNPLRAAGTQTDITERKRAEEELRLAAEVIQSMNEVVVLTDKDLRIQLVNHAFIRLMGQSEGDVLGKPLHSSFSDRHGSAFYSKLMKSLRADHYWQGELWQKASAQQEILTRIEIKRVEQFQSDKEYYVVIFSDITDQKRREDKLLYLANYDTLTGLPNRALFHQRLSNTIERASDPNNKSKGFSLMCVDVDHFKHINDSLGHGIGDQLLQRVALTLKQQIPNTSGTVARLGGDEFTLLLPEFIDIKNLEDLAQQILTTFEHSLTVEHHEIIISPSIGISRYPQDGNDSITLLKNTESALHFAKSKGRRNFQFYNEDIQTKTLRKLTVGNQLRRALNNNELELVYQPKLDLTSNKIIGMEALLRWHNANIGAIEPDEFIAIAEETGQVNEIGNWVLREACEQAKKWQVRNFNLPVSVNISARQFQQQSLYKTVASLLAESHMPPELLELEITETMLMEDPDSAITTLTQLKEMGVRIAVDDFGTGYSSLSYLKKLPIDTLKIDKAFVQDLGKDKDDEAITNAIISLAKNLKLNVIAEGVENSEQLYFLKNAGCQQVQGFLIAHPMTAQASTLFCDEKLLR
ncbi:bifunctional diguanylate cyclase/phosphodiesterase [Pleionea mediterranea]|uniref:cyclic-guanylate-specific phosphodiesterase n=1 Tax=Pleionea mediterranea TaxID=523701 RepID=A0A316G8I1_9GAMM|nr:GGDEF and EAL domain-containing protein [Pleionea mediterranea]PWK50777.1 diguanylate cyclase/phosphodiesterase with PAS/PAC sensor(s) [Pleionea mediterranea]